MNYLGPMVHDMTETELRLFNDAMRVLNAYAKFSELAHSTLTMRAVGSPQLVSRWQQGKPCTVATYGRLMQWASDNWPDHEVVWPRSIHRPHPSKDAPETAAVHIRKRKKNGTAKLPA